MTEFLLGAAAFVLTTVALGLVRLLAAQLLGTGGVAALLLFGVASNVAAAADIALVLALPHQRSARSCRRWWSRDPSFWSCASGSTCGRHCWTCPPPRCWAAWAPRPSLLGNLMALQQTRLKLLIAYSTVALIGYLFLIFPLAALGPGPTWALAGEMLQLVAHALAKGALFLAAGLIYGVLGHALSRPARPLTPLQTPGCPQVLVMLTLALAALLLGLLPAGVFDLIAVGRDPSPAPIATAWAGLFGWRSVAAGVVPVLGVVGLILVFAPWGGGPRSGLLGWPARGAAAVGAGVAGLYGALRSWPVAGALCWCWC